jgi:hypothetical protein
MSNNGGPRFHYHAHALALQGEITHPFQEKLEPQAPSAVSPFGGFGTARADPFNLKEVISHRGARSRTEAGYNPNTDEHYALANVVLDGLNLSDVVTADSIVARVAAVHSTRQPEPAISPAGSMIQGLRIFGHLVELIPLVSTYHTHSTMQGLRDHYKNDPQYQSDFHTDAYIGKQSDVPPKKQKFFPWLNHKPDGALPEFRGHTIVPLFRIKDPQIPGVEVHGNVIHIDNFGRIRLGELVISCEERRVTMLHADLGSPQDANLSAAVSCTGNGQTDPK